MWISGSDSVVQIHRNTHRLGATYDDIRDKPDEKVYRMFYPNKHVLESLYSIPDHPYVHAELKQTSGNLKLLLNEYNDSCFQNHSFSLGYTKFCKVDWTN